MAEVRVVDGHPAVVIEVQGASVRVVCGTGHGNWEGTPRDVPHVFVDPETRGRVARAMGITKPTRFYCDWFKVVPRSAVGPQWGTFGRCPLGVMEELAALDPLRTGRVK